MDEIFLVLLYLVTLVFVLVIIALLGHFLWIAGAELLQMLLGVEDKRDRPREAILELEVDRDRRATRRYLKRLLNLRLLDRTTVGRVEGAALLDERKLHRTPDRTPATPAAKRLETGLPAGPISSPQQAPTPPPSPSPRREPLERALPTVQAPARQPETVAGQAPTRERRSFSDLLSAFMVEKNIRWGELVGSLLIVFCSAALVVSFWTQIARVPLAQVGLFTAITAGLFGIGLYTEHRWRLANTSRGLLLIATLLVPLNFLTIGAFARDVGPLALSVLGLETVAAALFGFLLYRSAAIYAAGRAAQVTAAVLGASLLQLVVRRATGPELALPWLVAIGALPLLLYGGVIGSALRQAAGSRTLSLDEARSLLVLLGLGTFATSVALGLFVHLSGEARTLATRLSTLMSLYGLPALLSGLHFWRATPSGAPAWLRVTGTTVGVLGLLVMAAGFTLAWPQPAYLVSVATLTSAAALVIAFRARIPEAQAVAGCLAIFAYLVLALVVIDPELGRQVERATQLLNALLSGLAGQLLVPATIMTAIFSALLRRRGLAEHGRWLLKAGVPAAAACVVLVGWHGLGRTGDPQHVAATP